MEYSGRLSVTSEIGRLREVITHTPGREVEMVTPKNLGRMLFDDILYLHDAVEDHKCLVRILRKAGVVVHEFQDLLRETLHLIGSDRRKEFVRLVSRLEGCPGDYCEKLSNYSPEGLADVLIGGEPREESLARFLRRDIYAFPPLPNLMFVRDCATVVGSGVILSSMAHAVRSREVLLFDLVFRNHPRFCRNGVPPWLWLGDADARLKSGSMFRGLSGFEHISLEGTNLKITGVEPELKNDGRNIEIEADYIRFTHGPNYALEGGSIFVLSPDTLLIGCGERTSAAAIDALARNLLGSRSLIRNILVAIMSEDSRRHLDTYLSIVDCDQYVIYPPLLQEYGARVTMVRLWLDKRQIRVRSYECLKEALESVGITYESRNVGYCAGVEPPSGGPQKGMAFEPEVEERILQDREWHNHALNMLALAPGKLIASVRNRSTLDFLEHRCGYEIIPDRKFCMASTAELQNWLATGQRIVVTLEDHEVSRGVGGPRSLVLPLRREEPECVQDGLQRADTGSEEKPTCLVIGEGPPPEPDVQTEKTSSLDLEGIKLRIRSETGRLRQVVLHRPSREIARLTPANHKALLFDDVLELERARAEHDVFSSLLTELGVKVYEVEDLIVNAADEELIKPNKVAALQREAVKGLEGKWLPEYTEALEDSLRKSSKNARTLARMLIEGIPADRSLPALFLHDADPFLLTPIPNILFMRDSAAVVGDNVIVCHMRKPARIREGLLLHYAFRALVKQEKIQPRDLWFDFFEEDAQLADSKEQDNEEDLAKALKERGELQRVEGGDILVIHDQVLAIGCSERTTREMLGELARQLFEKQEDDDPRIEEIYAVLMPSQRSSMHLDTIFTMISEDECLVYEPMIMPAGVEQVRVVRLTPKRDEHSQSVSSINTEVVNSLVKELEQSLKKHTGNPYYHLTPLFAGGENPLYQDREQWYDGPNVLAIAPGVVIGYDRNYRTFRELEKIGYQVCDARDVIGEQGKPIEEQQWLAPILQSMDSSIPDADSYEPYRQKFAIRIEGRELSRARGGPHCMSMPLCREDVSWDRSGRTRRQ